VERIRRGRPSPEQVAGLLALLDQRYGESRCSLKHDNAYQLLVATILSAQCTDVRVNMVTPALFECCPTPADLDAIPRPKLERMIKSTGFFRNKSKSLKGTARVLVTEMDGQVPADMDRLLRLPGVARKTANVVLGTAFGIPEGVVVDTHVLRIAWRLGLSRHRDPKRVEADLMKVLPRDRWILFAHQVIDHGRSLCPARTPRCGECPLEALCAFAGKPEKSRRRARSRPARRAARRGV
jgi:endonuclease-3